MKYITKYLCLSLVFLIPFTTHAKFTGEVIFRTPGKEKDYNELWITHIENANYTRLLYQHEWTIYGYAVQKDSPHIVISAGPITSDIFLINRNQLGARARNLTENRFNGTGRVNLSSNGDLLFTNAMIQLEPDVIEGLYYMPHDEINKVIPQATLLKEGTMDFIRWSPNGQQFIYRTDNGLFLYNLHTGEDSLITKDKLYPDFSPDGKTLAFIHQPVLEPGIEIDVISLETLHPQLFTIDLENHVFFGIKWPTEKYFVYGIYDKQNKIRRHYVIRIDRGPPEQILEDMEDIFENGLPSFKLGNTTFAVEPTNRLTTVWGKLKILNTK